MATATEFNEEISRLDEQIWEAQEALARLLTRRKILEFRGIIAQHIAVLPHMWLASKGCYSVPGVGNVLAKDLDLTIQVLKDLLNFVETDLVHREVHSIDHAIELCKDFLYYRLVSWPAESEWLFAYPKRHLHFKLDF